MTRSQSGRLAAAAACSALSTAFACAQLYAATGSNGVAGTLYTLDPATGAPLTTVGALADVTGAGYGITGMVFMGGTLYGDTSNSSPTDPGWLVRIDPNTGLVTPIGPYGFSGTMSDITGIGGTLYGWHASGDHSLYTINALTGAATLVGNSGNPGFGGGGLAADSFGNLFASPNAASNPPGGFYSVNPLTGAIALINNHSGLNGVINSMDFIGSTLYGIESDQGLPAMTHLVTIDTGTAAVTELGQSVDNLDSLAYNPVPEPATLAVLGTGFAALAKRRRRA